MPLGLSSRIRERSFRKSPPPQVASSVASSATSADRPAKEVRRAYLRQYVAWLWPYRASLGFILGLSVLVATLDLAWPYSVKKIIDLLQDSSVPAEKKFTPLNIFGAVILGVLFVKQSVDSFRAYRVQALNAKVIFRLRKRLYARLIDLPLNDLGEMKSGGIVSRLSGDVDAVSGLVQMAIIQPGVSALRIVLTFGILTHLSWRLAIAALIALPPLALSSFLWLRRVRPIYRSIREDAGHIDGRVSETFGGLRVVRAFRREPRERLTYALGHHTVIRKGLFATRMELVLEAVWGLLIPITSLLIVWYGGRLVLRHEGTTVGDVYAFQIYAVLLLPPIWQMVQSVSTTQRSLAAMERIFGVLAMHPDKPDAAGAVEPPTPVHEFRFDGVGFEYRPGVPVLKDFNLVVPGGATVALVGPSGAGKTTVTDLVARFHDPTAGRISLNGVDLRHIKLRGYRSLLALVQQETFLFDGSVRDNIAYGRSGASDEQIEDAARRANAHDFIAALPQGYATTVGERGFKLSGGQRQRLSIARAILADPQILILDEATSNLDTESEQLIQASLEELFKSRTTFVIAHRLSTIARADLIVVMSEGRIVETGTHEDLMHAGGVYHAMVERQRLSFHPTVLDA